MAPRPRLEPNPNFPTHEAPCYQCALGRFAGCGGQIEKWCLLPLMTQLIVHPETYRLRLFTSATFQHKLSMRGARSPLAGISLLFIHYYSCLIWLSSFFAISLNNKKLGISARDFLLERLFLQQKYYSYSAKKYFSAS